MAVWEQLEVSKAHVAYACVGVFSAVFSLVSLFVKEKLYIGESTVAGIFGLIVGPVCLNWFNPLKWGNSDSITLEITRIVLCLQIFAVAVELPRKYMLKHWLSVTMLLLPVMTVGWLIIGLFVWIVIPGLNFSASLLVSACITATDPILAQSVVSGKFAQRVPGHLRNLLSAESGCNDGMAFPFLYLSLNLIIHPGNGREIVKDWICVTILYECIFGCLLGVFIGYVGRRMIRFAEEKNIIDRESFLAFYVVLAFCCAGFGSILGVDDLLVSFAAGAAFAWDGWFSKKTEETKISTVIDLLLNYAYFIYFGAIIPWKQFNNAEIGCNVWRLIILSIVVIFLRRIPAVMILTPVIPDIKSWREALFVGHFGPIGVGAIFAAILARSELEASITEEPTPLMHIPPKGSKHWQLIACVWPITCFFIVTSIIVHGSSVAVITLGRHLNTITLTKTFTTHTMGNGKSSWMQRLPSLDKTGRSFSLHRVDTAGVVEPKSEKMSRSSTVETSGVPARPVGGMRRRKHKKKRPKHRRKMSEVKLDIFTRSKSRLHHNEYDDELNDLGRERLQREKEARAATFALSAPVARPEINVEAYSDESRNLSVEELPEYPVFNSEHEDDDENYVNDDWVSSNAVSTQSPENMSTDLEKQQMPLHGGFETASTTSDEVERLRRLREEETTGDIAYQDGEHIIVENKHGEIIDHAQIDREPLDEEEGIAPYSGNVSLRSTISNQSNNSLSVLKKILTPTSLSRMHSLIETKSQNSNDSGGSGKSFHRGKYRAYKMADQLIIENDEGEVVRRYLINTHHEKDNSEDGVVSKALHAVGLRGRINSLERGSSSVPSATKNTNMKITKNSRTLTPAPQQFQSSNHYYDDDELNDDDSEDESDGRSTVEYEDSENDYDSDESDEETEFERQRRLNALGHVPAPSDRDDEEEPPVPITTASTRERTNSTSQNIKSKFSSIFRLKSDNKQ